MYDPFFAEARAALKRFNSRIPKVPAFPHVIVLRPQLTDFIQPCTRAEVIARLERLPPASIQGLRAIFLLAGTRKQQQSWSSELAYYGMYWRACVFLCACPLDWRYSRDTWRDFYLDDVLVHEVAHHIDRQQVHDKQDKEAFAHAYVQKQWSMNKKRLRKKSWGDR